MCLNSSEIEIMQLFKHVFCLYLSGLWMAIFFFGDNIILN